jgi:hypothetical protein
MAEPTGNADQGSARSDSVVETRVVSPRGARVTERVVVLSEKAAQRLEIRTKVPARAANGHK